VDLLFSALAVVLVILFVWGALSPRSQWRALVGWSVADAHAVEPGSTSLTLRRIVSALGAVALITTLVVSSGTRIDLGGASTDRATPLERMWGVPAPTLVDRTIQTQGDVPFDQAAGRMVAAQSLEDGPARILFDMPRFSLLGDDAPPGLAGVPPEPGTTSFGPAELLVNSRGPVLCIPRSVVVQESEEAVAVGVFYGLPNGADGIWVHECDDDGSVTSSVLVPVPLQSPLGDRAVTDLEGAPLELVDPVS
jgi:hypothetical protein